DVPHRGRAVDVALHEVPADTVRGAQRQLEVHRRARLELSERGALERLGHGARLEAPLANPARGEAHAVDGDRIALPELSGGPGADREGGPPALWPKRGHAAHVRDQARKHELAADPVTGRPTTRAGAHESAGPRRSVPSRRSAGAAPRRCARPPFPPGGREPRSLPPTAAPRTAEFRRSRRRRGMRPPAAARPPAARSPPTSPPADRGPSAPARARFRGGPRAPARRPPRARRWPRAWPPARPRR